MQLERPFVTAWDSHLFEKVERQCGTISCDADFGFFPVMIVHQRFLDGNCNAKKCPLSLEQGSLKGESVDVNGQSTTFKNHSPKIVWLNAFKQFGVLGKFTRCLVLRQSRQ